MLGQSLPRTCLVTIGFGGRTSISGRCGDGRLGRADAAHVEMLDRRERRCYPGLGEVARGGEMV